MAQVILMCGAAGSGKSTHARALARNGFVALSFDAIAWERGHREHPLGDEAREAVHDELQARMMASLDRGERVVIDSSFWSRASRDRYRRVLAARGVEPVVHHVTAPREVVLARLAARRGGGPDDIEVQPRLARAYLDGFEVPTADEGPLVEIDGTAPEVPASPAEDGVMRS